MKLTIIGDPHLTHGNIEKVQEIMARVEQLGNTTVWLGDLLDTKEVIRGKCLSAWLDYFNTSPLKHIVLVGNHDLFNLETTRHSLEAFRPLKNVTLVEAPTKIAEGIYAIPYMHHDEDLKAAIKPFEKDSILFGHLELKDFDFGNGRICDKGMTERSFKKFKRVISGHFHSFQEKGNLVYLGTPFSHSFGESNQDKYIAVYDTVSNELDLIPSELPKHITIHLDCDLIAKNGPEMRHNFLDLTDENFNKHYYRVFLEGSQENINAFPKQMYLDGGTKGKLNIKFLSRVRKEETGEVVVIEESASNHKQFETWAKEVAKLPKSVVDLGLEILEQVRG